MKFYGTILILMIISTVALSKSVNLEQFNKRVIADIDAVIEDNPELYEKKNSGRSPASVQNEVDGTTKKLDEIEEQASGQKSW